MSPFLSQLWTITHSKIHHPVLQRGMFRAVLDSVLLGRCCVGGDNPVRPLRHRLWPRHARLHLGIIHTDSKGHGARRVTTCGPHSRGEFSLESRLGFVLSCWHQQAQGRCWSPGMVGERCFGSLLSQLLLHSSPGFQGNRRLETAFSTQHSPCED